MIDSMTLKSALVDKGVIDQQELEQLINLYQDNIDIFLHLIQAGKADRNELGKLYANTEGVAYINLKKIIFQPEIVNKLPEEFARKHKIILLYQFGGVITAATIDPANSFMLRSAEKVVGCQISPLFAFPDEIDEVIEEQYSIDDSLQDLTKKLVDNITLKQKYDSPTVLVSDEKAKSLFSETTQKQLMNTNRNIIDDAINGKIPKTEDCEILGNTITTEINEKINTIYCIKQLRLNDEYTYSHSINVAIMSAVVGKVLGFSNTLIKELTLGGLLHDIGKMRIPKVLLYSPEQLSKQEYEIVKRHTTLGYQIVKMMKMPEKIAEVSLYHHEKMNGTGYPEGLRSEQIPLYVQIVTITNIYDALISERPNKRAIPHYEAINIMLLEERNSFNIDLLYRFLNIVYKQDIDSLKKVFKTIIYD